MSLKLLESSFGVFFFFFCELIKDKMFGVFKVGFYQIRC
jgi:hypothetical protein